MDLVITGDVNRPGQEINILRLFSRLAYPLGDLGHRPRLELGAPLAFPAWVAGYEQGAFPVSGDVVIGFELPPCAKRALPRWIDVRLHPIRFAGDLYSVTSNLRCVAGAVASSTKKKVPPVQTE